MLLGLVQEIFGELPQDLRFLYAFGCMFVLYILVKMLKNCPNIKYTKSNILQTPYPIGYYVYKYSKHFY